VAIVNNTLASTLWPEGSALDRTLLVTIGGDDVEVTVVGRVADSLGGVALNGMGPQIFLPATQRAARGGFLTIRSAGPLNSTIDAARAAVSQLDPNLPAENVRTMENVVATAFQPVVTARNLLSGFGLFALVLAALGVYGVAAYAVSQRTHEIGVRMAIGASTGNIITVIMRTAAGTVAVGAGLGVLAVFGLLAAVTSTLGDSGISPLLPVGVGLLLTAVAAFASWVPARRATRVDPLLALRGE